MSTLTQSCLPLDSCPRTSLTFSAPTLKWSPNSGQNLAPPPEVQALIGITLNTRYRLDDYLAHGYFSYVFQARDLQNDIDVAVKILRTDRLTSDSILELDTERDLLSRLSNRDHVIDSLDGYLHTHLLQSPNSTAQWPVALHYVAMELADGCLIELVLARDLVEWHERLSLFRSVAKGVHQTHISEIFHRDIKADNVLLFEDDAQADAKLCDFGRAAAIQSSRRYPADWYLAGRGDLAYSPPEFIWEIGGLSGPDWQKADLYLLGSVLFELATGQQLTSMVGAAVRGLAGPHLRLPPDDRRTEFAARVNELQSHFETAWSVFDDELPPPIRQQGGRLLRSLTAPDPRRRGPHTPLRSDYRWDATWILRQVDIMRKILRHDRARSERIARRKAG